MAKKNVKKSPRRFEFFTIKVHEAVPGAPVKVEYCKEDGSRIEILPSSKKNKFPLALWTRNTIVRNDQNGVVYIRVHNKDGKRMISHKIDSSGMWKISVAKKQRLPELSMITNPVKRLLFRAGVNLARQFKEVSANELQELKVKKQSEDGWVFGENWGIEVCDEQFCYDSLVDKVRVVKGETLDEVELRQFGDALAKAAYGEFADTELMQIWDEDREACVEWLKKKLSLYPVVNSYVRYQIWSHESEPQEDGTEISTLDLDSNRLRVLGRLTARWGQSFLAELFGGDLHKSYAEALDSGCAAKIAEQIACMATVVKVYRGSKPVVKLIYEEKSLYLHQILSGDDIGEMNLLKALLFVQFGVRRKGLSDELLARAHRVDRFQPLYPLTRFLSFEEGMFSTTSREVDVPWKSVPKKTLGSQGEWICLKQKMHDRLMGPEFNFSLLYRMLKDSVVSLSGEQHSYTPANHGYPVALLQLGDEGRALSFLNREGYLDSSLMLRVPKSKTKNFIVVCLCASTKKVSVWGFSVSREQSDEVVVSCYDPGCRFTAQLVQSNQYYNTDAEDRHQELMSVSELEVALVMEAKSQRKRATRHCESIA